VISKCNDGAVTEQQAAPSRSSELANGVNLACRSHLPQELRGLRAFQAEQVGDLIHLHPQRMFVYPCCDCLLLVAQTYTIGFIAIRLVIIR
jgi:hypothetical protein